MTPAQLIAAGWIKGLDVSDHQSLPINWKRLYAEGYRFVWVKLTEGETFASKTGEEKALAAQDAGFLVGGYHYARPDNGNSPAREAVNFAAGLLTAGETVVSGLPAVLDYEEKIKQGHGTAREFNEGFKRRLYELTGLTPWYYSSLGTYLKDAPEGAKLWVAAYIESLLNAERYACWQYTGQGRVPGYAGPLDLNLMNPNEWKELTK